MSLPRQSPPALPHEPLLALFNPSKHTPRAVGRRAEFFIFFAQTILPLLERYRERLDAVYCSNNGRPAWDPVRLLGVLILQFVMRAPDRQAAESVQYDLRWRLALHMDFHEPTFDPTVLTVFRNRLIQGSQEELAFEAVLDHLVEQGWVPRRSRQRLDSTHVRGLLRVMSRLECVRETIRLFLEDVEARGCFPETWAAYWDRYVEKKPDPRSKAPVLESLFVQAGLDVVAIINEASGNGPLAAYDSFILLQRVFEENYIVDSQENVRQTRAQPTGAVHNPHEPEAQWSSKSTTRDKTWVGYKVQVAETVQEEARKSGEPTANFLAAIITQDATASDKAGMAEVLIEQERMGLEKPSTLYLDGAYVSSETLNDALEQSRELLGPAPASPDRGKVFTLDPFDVQVEQRYATCPAGQRSSNCSRLPDGNNVVYRIEWNNRICGSCPLRDQCVPAAQKHRTIVVGALYSLLQERRRAMKTDAFKKEMHRRNGIEGTQSELVRGYGLRQARYRGKARSRLQNYLIGAACNIRRLFRRLAWIAAQAGGVATVCPATPVMG